MDYPLLLGVLTVILHIISIILLNDFYASSILLLLVWNLLIQIWFERVYHCLLLLNMLRLYIGTIVVSLLIYMPSSSAYLELIRHLVRILEKLLSLLLLLLVRYIKVLLSVSRIMITIIRSCFDLILILNLILLLMGMERLERWLTLISLVLLLLLELLLLFLLYVCLPVIKFTF